jgi:hypothetical protein
MNMMDNSNKKIESLEKVIENLQQNVLQLEISTNFFMSKVITLDIVHAIPLPSLLSSRCIIYDVSYNHVTTVEELRGLQSQCKKQIIVGAIQGSSSMILTIAAMRPSEILSLHNPLNQPTKYGDELAGVFIRNQV